MTLDEPALSTNPEKPIQSDQEEKKEAGGKKKKKKKAK